MQNKINKNSNVIVDYEIISNGDVCDRKSGFEVVMDDDTLIKTIRDGLIGMAEGENISIEVEGETSELEESKDAYLRLNKDSFLEEATVGNYYRAEGLDGSDIGIRVVEIEGDEVIGSGNHPLINKDFTVNLYVVGVAESD